MTSLTLFIIVRFYLVDPYINLKVGNITPNDQILHLPPDFLNIYQSIFSQFSFKPAGKAGTA